MVTSKEERLERAKRRRRTVILLVFIALIGALVFFFRGVLMPFLVALFVAYLIDPLIQRMAPARFFGLFKLGRAGSIIIVYLIFLCTLYVGGRFAIPAIGAQLRQARQDLPKLRAVLEDQIQKTIEQWEEFVGPDEENGEANEAGTESETEPAQDQEQEPAPADEAGDETVVLHLSGGGRIAGQVAARTESQIALLLGGELQLVELERIEREELLDRPSSGPQGFEIKEILPRGLDQLVTRLDEVLRLAIKAVGVLVGTIYTMVLIMMITAFIVIDRDKILGFFQRVPPERYRPVVLKLGGYIDRGLAGVIRGQIMICTVNGLLTWVGLAILGVRYAGILGLIAGVLSLIPIFGTILSTIPVVLIAWGAGGFYKGLLALGWILLIHFVEANFLNPKIMGAASKIHPVMVIFALLAGEHAYGIVGALLAVPTWSIIQSSFKFYVLDRQDEAEEKSETPTTSPPTPAAV